MEERSVISVFMRVLEVLERADDPASGEERTLSEILRDEMGEIASRLKIAALSGKTIVYPTSYPINGTKELFFTSFDEDTSGKEHDFIRHIAIGANGYCEIRICPAAGAEWQSAETKEKLTSLSRFLEVILERRIMFENVSRLALIDMSSGLFNSSGMREAGGKLLSMERPSDYVGIFLNLKDTKFFNLRYDERLIESYLTSVSHKLFSFLDTDLEIAAHFGGDNFYVLLLKERLESFQEFLMESVAEFQNGEETMRIPFFARMGIYEGKDGDHIGIFLNNASIAFAATRASGQDVVVFRKELLEGVK